MRRALDRTMVVASAACAIIALSVIGMIIAILLRRGGSAISVEFLTDTMRSVGAAGGIFYNVVGTLILVGTALLVSLPVATSVALVHGVYLRSQTARERLWLILTTLHGIPSILFGLFGLMLFVRYFGWGKSWLTGGILLGMMILPTVAVAFVERIRSLPGKYLDAAAALGLSQSQIIWSVILPQCGAGLVTGSLLGLARAAGETAPIMFTATIFAGATIPHGIRESPVLSLPYHIFTLSQDSFEPEVAARVWAAAFVLLVLVFILSAMALPVRLRIREEARHG